jgi:hypothetical protein
MKTRVLLVMSAFLLSATGPVFAWTNQDQLACELAQVNCPAEAKRLEPRATAIKSVNKNWDQLACELAQVNCPAETKRLEPRATATKSVTKNWDQLACELAQVNCPAETKIP